jgi:hypothetical protein
MFEMVLMKIKYSKTIQKHYKKCFKAIKRVEKS